MATESLLKAMTEGGSIRSVGMITLIVLGRGRGALITPSMDFIAVRKWTESRTATGIEYRDLNLFMERFETCVAKSGSSVSTKGHTSALLALAKEMKTAGFEVSEWNFPKAVWDELAPKRVKPLSGSSLQDELGISDEDLENSDQS